MTEEGLFKHKHFYIHCENILVCFCLFEDGVSIIYRIHIAMEHQSYKLLSKSIRLALHLAKCVLKQFLESHGEACLPKREIFICNCNSN